MTTTDSQEAATKQSGCAFAKAAPSSTSNVDDNGDMEAGVSEAQEENLPFKEIGQCDEDDVTRTCNRDLAAATKSCLGYPRPQPPPATEAAVTCAVRGLAPLYGLSRTTKSLSQPKSPQYQLQSSDLSHPLVAN
jgi:hypothetical protein